MSESRRPLVNLLYLLTVFLSAFLLFQVQPLISKYILPWFGGSPAVWTTCMLFFQVALFGGYIYAHVLVAKLSPKMQAVVHFVVLGAALSFLPIMPDSVWKPETAGNPSGRILLLLGVTVGLPYFALSATGPLLQGWFLQAVPGRTPYRLYALSNAGSLLALLSYPFAFEPSMTTQLQAQFWSWGFGVFAVCCTICAFVMARRPAGAGAGAGAGITEAAADEPAVQDGTTAPDGSQVTAPSGGQVMLWFGLAAVPSVMLLATTSQVCTDIAVVPFLWVLPLSLYLLTFILCFDSDRWYQRKLFGTSLMLFVGGTLLLLWDAAMSWRLVTSIAIQAATYFGLLFCACMICHGELVRLKPHPKYLTLFYLSMSAGGALGGIFVAIIAPILFKTLFELHIGIVATCVLLLAVIFRDKTSSMYRGRRAGLWAAMATVVIALGWSLNAHAGRVTRNAVAIARNFYGILRVDGFNQSFVMKHGSIRHGHQFRDLEKRHLPTTYYGHASGAGLAMAQHHAGEARHFGVIGLGAGTLAAYAKPQDRVRIYEINPAVVAMADAFFTYLSECKGKYEVVTADGRIALENEPPQEFDVLVLDAFSGDAIPTHLLTKECFELYLKHLKQDGLLAFHITNLHVNLRPVCKGLADEFGLVAKCTYAVRNKDLGTQDTMWVLMSRDESVLNNIQLGDTLEVALGDRSILWTDHWSNLMSVIERSPSIEIVKASDEE
jgi:hypothetical protein